MVSLEERQQYIEGLIDQPKQKALFALVNEEKSLVPESDVSETDLLYYSAIKAINDDSKNAFIDQYGKISKRKITENSTAPFIHDDFLIFTLIVGVSKFNSDKEWLIGVVNKRAKNEITTTFQNILSGDFLSKANNYSLVLVFLFLLDKSKINDEKLTEAYDSIVNSNQAAKNDFLRIIQYRAFDVIIKLKIPRSTDDLARLLDFEMVFKRKVKGLSILIYNTFIILVLFSGYKALQYLPEDKKLVINDINLIIGIGAIIGLSGNFIPWLKTQFQDMLLRLFGYKTEKK